MVQQQKRGGSKKLMRSSRHAARYAQQRIRTTLNKLRKLRAHIVAHPGDQQAKSTLRASIKEK